MLYSIVDRKRPMTLIDVESKSMITHILTSVVQRIEYLLKCINFVA